MREALRCIVFSRDRAMQLDAFLASVERWAPALHQSLAVLYRTTTPAFARAYEALRAARPSVEWIEERRSFHEEVLGALGSERLLVFHTDDDVFFDDVPSFELREDEVCFTLRLGLNTTYCYPLNVVERLERPRVETDRISWEWGSQPPGAYSYPLALNGHVFRGDEARAWLARVEYRNPNELEAALQALGREVRPMMASFRRSRVVSIPANIVNDTFPNRHGGEHDVADLNDRFLRGERIAVERMDFTNVVACHQEIAFVFDRPS